MAITKVSQQANLIPGYFSTIIQLAEPTNYVYPQNYPDSTAVNFAVNFGHLRGNSGNLTSHH